VQVTPEKSLQRSVSHEVLPSAPSAPRISDSEGYLRRIKLLHTVVWGFFVSCILAIPLAATWKAFGMAFALIAVVAIEVVVLLVNGFRCPLTGIAAKYTPDRQENFDIYLPLWLARYNKQIFGALYIAAVIYTLIGVVQD
jgi:hypothetical protein